MVASFLLVVYILSQIYTQIKYENIFSICILVFVVLSKLNAQNNLSGLFEVNYNTYSHNSLKQFQQEFINDLSEVDLRVNDDYGANIGYTLG